MFTRLQRESENLMSSVIALIYFMRGSVTLAEIMNQVTPGVRQQMTSFVERRLEQEGKKLYPVY
jgi:hypothetical protein